MVGNRTTCESEQGVVERAEQMFLSAEDKKYISEAVKRAEQLTSGEIVFAVADASARYHHANLVASLTCAVIAAAGYLALPVIHTIGLLLWTEIIAFALCYAVIPNLNIRRWFIQPREMDELVHDAAFREFYASGLHKTRDSNGIVIYLSLLERRVVVLGDKGIHDRMGNEHWDSVRDAIIRGIRQRKARDGICAGVEICGQALAEHFPRRPDDVNELPDQVIDRTTSRAKSSEL